MRRALRTVQVGIKGRKTRQSGARDEEGRTAGKISVIPTSYTARLSVEGKAVGWWWSAIGPVAGAFGEWLVTRSRLMSSLGRTFFFFFVFSSSSLLFLATNVEAGGRLGIGELLAVASWVCQAQEGEGSVRGARRWLAAGNRAYTKAGAGG
ncbi:hypothetical protein EV126DRAFT_157502 [Verticillium dahliae]|nr:hypothetical protein EV126DRAFT_157502 [Verticillium dahliae]